MRRLFAVIATVTAIGGASASAHAQTVTGTSATPVATVPGTTAMLPAPSSALIDPSLQPRRMMIPSAVAMRAMTQIEEQAHALWSLRAALNVAALQCQFSPFLATVRNYNQMLRHHSGELDRARKTLASHFKRYDGSQSQKQFDQYTTRTYNSFSTLDAQLSFCDAAGAIGRQALALPKGQLSQFAVQRLTDIRASLVPTRDPLTVVSLDWIAFPRFDNPCLDKKGRRKKRC